MNLACAQARATIEPLLPRRLADLDATLRLLLEGLGELEGESAPALAAAQHIGSCPACQAWLNLAGRYPEQAERRQRIAQYCCFDMFSAVTDAAYPVRFSCVEGKDFEAYWLLGGEVLGGLSVAKFCPWCGARLPAQPFERGTISLR